MAIMATTTRAVITDNGPLSEALETKLHGVLLLKDVDLIRQNQHSSCPYILLAHAIELLLKSYVKADLALRPRRSDENMGHDLIEALRAARDAGLKTTHSDKMFQKASSRPLPISRQR